MYNKEISCAKGSRCWIVKVYNAGLEGKVIDPITVEDRSSIIIKRYRLEDGDYLILNQGRYENLFVRDNQDKTKELILGYE